jgi:hypothetical protein
VSSSQILATDKEDDKLAGFYEEEEVTQASKFGSTPASIPAVRQSILGTVQGMDQALDTIKGQLKARMTKQESKR